MSAEPLIPDVPGYQILERIGEGASGIVYLARQTALDRKAAIKILSVAHGKDLEDRLERFRREAHLMARIAHPNVLAVYDAGLVGQRPYLITEYVDGGNLRSLMTPGEPMPLQLVARILEPVANALASLHRQGIIHRDLKPENILLYGPDSPKVSDFGIAVLRTEIGALTRHGETFGTFGYIAPEQHYGLPIDERVDQYSLAALAYELLTGGELPLGVIQKPSEHNPRLSAGIDKVLIRALRDDPSQRFASIEEFSEVLMTELRNQPTGSTRQRRTNVLVMSVALLAVVLTGAGLWWTGILPSAPTADRQQAPTSAPEPKTRNSVGMTLVLIPAGELAIEPADHGQDAPGDEPPARRLHVERPFYLSTCEVTVGQFREFVEETGYQTEAEQSGGGFTFDEKSKKMRQAPEITWRNPGHWKEQRDDHPVVQVSWNDAKAFCTWLSHRESLEYRLPTEAEWEYACRAGARTASPMADKADALNDYAWYAANANFVIHPVGSKLPNDFGLFNMLGNVKEWCSDAHVPAGQADAEQPLRPLRGGAMDTQAKQTSCSACEQSYPTYRCRTYGFRICRSIPATSAPPQH